jgi:hypothetical protein
MEMWNVMEMEGKMEMEMERERDVKRDVEKEMEMEVVFFIFLMGLMLFRTVEWKCPFYLLENNFTHSSLLKCVIAKVFEKAKKLYTFHFLHFIQALLHKMTIFAFWKILWQKSKLLRVRIQLFVFLQKFWRK